MSEGLPSGKARWTAGGCVFQRAVRCSLDLSPEMRVNMGLAPATTRRMKSVSLRLAFCALQRSASEALARSRRSIGPRPSHSKKAVVIPRMARQSKSWAKRLDAFLEFSDRQILQGKGNVTAEIAKTHAESEFEKYRIVQDRLFKSDFDRMVKKLDIGYSEGDET